MDKKKVEEYDLNQIHLIFDNTPFPTGENKSKIHVIKIKRF